VLRSQETFIRLRDLKRAGVIAMLAALLGLLCLTGPGASATTRYCENTYGGDVVFARHLGCSRAQQVVRAWARSYKRFGRPSNKVLGFTCNGRDDPIEGLVVFCHRGRKRVTFFANVPERALRSRVAFGAVEARFKFVACPPYDASQGLGAGPFAVRASGISCRQAKRVGRTFVRHGDAALPAWRCSIRRKGEEGSVTTCRRHAAVVRFFAGG
jgi:hypothetical protein